MRCPLCLEECPGDSRFCGSCGARLDETVACPRCAAPNSLRNDSCLECGTQLADWRQNEPTLPQGERRQLTVMFCDLVGSTQLSESLDLEDLQDVMRAYQRACGRVIQRFEGQVAQVLGDGLLAYFGYPHAHEDDPSNAVRAGLAVLAGLRSLNENLAQRVPLLRERPLDVRIGIHTGEVVVGDVGSRGTRERLALGDTVNLAARLMTASRPGRVVISQTTERLVEGRFHLDSQGPLTMKGIAEPVEVFWVRGIAGDRNRLERAAPRGLTPFVGRESEIATLLAAWGRAREGNGRTVLIEGEAGVGKSRLLHDLRVRLADEPHRFLEAQGSNQHTSSAFHPILALIRRGVLVREAREDSSPLERLEQVLAEANLPLGEAVPLFASLLSIPLDARYEAASLSAEARRRKTLEAMVEWVRRIPEPVVFVAEDLHWMDPSTLELLDRLIAQVEEGSLLLICTFRPSFQPEWTGSGVTQLLLGALDGDDSDRLLRHVAGGRELPETVRRQIVERADGVPLFLEELTKSVLEADASSQAAIPATLRDSLMARLDRLGETRHVAALASVIGRRFSRELLAAATDLPEPMLERGLAQLVRAELLFQQGDERDLAYMFKHALIQDVAYQSLLRSDRRAAHARVADAMETRFPQRASMQPGLVAHHWDRAHRPREAIGQYRAAGLRALDRSAHQEAITHLQNGINLVDCVESAERPRLEIGLRTTLGMVLVASRGYGNEEVAKTNARARELCRFVGEGPELYDALTGLYLYHSARAEFKMASELAAELVALSERAGEEFVLAWAHHFSGMSRFYEGRFTRALEHFELAIALKDDGLETPEWSYHEHDLAVVARSYAAMTLAILGRVDSARDVIDRAIELGRQSAHPLNLAFALGFSTLVYQSRGEALRVLANAGETIDVSLEQAFPVYLGMGLMMRGWAQAQQAGADREEVIGQMNRGMAHTSTTGTRTEGARALALLAEAQRALGGAEDALKTVLAARAFASAKESPYWDAELLRLEGELRLELTASASEGEACLRRALACAREQSAGALELRAALSLARCLGADGRRREAHEALSTTCQGSSEGFDTPDRRAARDLLADLA